MSCVQSGDFDKGSVRNASSCIVWWWTNAIRADYSHIKHLYIWWRINLIIVGYALFIERRSAYNLCLSRLGSLVYDSAPVTLSDSLLYLSFGFVFQASCTCRCEPCRVCWSLFVLWPSCRSCSPFIILVVVPCIWYLSPRRNTFKPITNSLACAINDWMIRAMLRLLIQVLIALVRLI